jgi:prepilin peptidase CpaA
MTLPHGAVLVIAGVACVADLKTRRIPNVLTLGAAAGACGHYVVADGLPGLGLALGGWAVGLLLFLPVFALRGMGGGDVKLVAALGAWLGPGLTVWLALFTALAGGPLAIAVALSRGYLRQALSNVWALLTFWRVAGLQPHPAMTLDTPGTPRLPYAVPIAVGLVVTLWLRG